MTNRKAPMPHSREALPMEEMTGITHPKNSHNTLNCQELYCIDTLRKLQKCFNRRLALKSEIERVEAQIKTLMGRL